MDDDHRRSDGAGTRHRGVRPGGRRAPAASARDRGIARQRAGHPPAVRGLLDAEIAPDVEVWLVPVANPDGSAAGMRCNANGVDLNRNFPWEWRLSDGGPAPLSEPETQALVALVEQLQPDIVIWVHQPLGYVSAVGATTRRSSRRGRTQLGCPFAPTSRSTAVARAGRRSWPASRRC